MASKTYLRVKNLYADGVVPLQKLDEAEANMKASQTTEVAARAQYQMAEEGARKEDKSAATAIWEQASGVVSEVAAYVDATIITAPSDGEVVTIISEEGELVGTGFPIITLVDLSDVWVTFNLREDLMLKCIFHERNKEQGRNMCRLVFQTKLRFYSYIIVCSKLH